MPRSHLPRPLPRSTRYAPIRYLADADDPTRELKELAAAGNVEALTEALAVHTSWGWAKRTRYARRMVNDHRELRSVYSAIDAAASDTPFRREATGDHLDIVPARTMLEGVA